MAALSEANAVIRVLDAIGRVSGDTQFPSTVIIRKLDDVYRRLRRRLSAEFPTIYEKVSSNIVSTTGLLPKPSDCESIRVVEKQSGGNWYPISVAPSLNRSTVAGVSFYEIGANLQVVPPSCAGGTYRIFYIAAPAATVTTYDVPDGLEGIIIEETAAMGRQRHNELEQVGYHLKEAERIWDEAYMGLWHRYGSHGRSGLNQTRA